MNPMKPTPTEIAQAFLKGGNCAQAVLGQYAEELGYDREETDRVAACFGGGMLMGDTCGAVTGALMALGGLNIPQEKREELIAAFRAAHGCIDCAELVKGLEPGTPERKAVCDGLVAECLGFVCKETGEE